MKRGRRKAGQLNNRPNVMLCLAFVLLFCVGVSTYYVAGLYARYTTSASGEDMARVAAFQVSAIEDTEARDGEYDLSEAPLASYKIDLKNGSEVAVKYNIVITFEEPLPTGVEPQIEDKSGDLSADGKVYTFVDEGTMDIGTEAIEVLKLVSDNSSILENFASASDIDWSSLREFKVAVEFIQID